MRIFPKLEGKKDKEKEGEWWSRDRKKEEGFRKKNPIRFGKVKKCVICSSDDHWTFASKWSKKISKKKNKKKLISKRKGYFLEIKKEEFEDCGDIEGILDTSFTKLLDDKQGW